MHVDIPKACSILWGGSGLAWLYCETKKNPNPTENGAINKHLVLLLSELKTYWPKMFFVSFLPYEFSSLCKPRVPEHKAPPHPRVRAGA